MNLRTAGAVLTALAFAIAPLAAAPQASLNNPSVPTGEGDAIFALGEGGSLEPIAVRLHGKFMNAGPTEGEPSARLRMESNAAIASNGSRVHVIFGGRTIATVLAKVENGNATLTTPPSLHLGGNVNALASPTLGGHAKTPRRAPTPPERTAALTLAARLLAAPSATKLDVRNLTAIDLGHGPAIIGTINLRGTGVKRTDKRLFFIAERNHGSLNPTLTNIQSINVTEPLLEEPAEYLVDAIDLGDDTLSVVTRIIGYDAHTYAIYSRTKTGWKPIYSGGGVAL